MTRASGSVGSKNGRFSPSLLGQAGAGVRLSVGRRNGLGLGLGSFGAVVSTVSRNPVSPWKQ